MTLLDEACHIWRICSLQTPGTGWRRLIGSPKLQIIFHKRATKYRSFLRKMTYKDKGSYDSTPPCMNESRHIQMSHGTYKWVITHTTEFSHTRMRYDMYEQIMSNMNGSCHEWMSCANTQIYHVTPMRPPPPFHTPHVIKEFISISISIHTDRQLPIVIDTSM